MRSKAKREPGEPDPWRLSRDAAASRQRLERIVRLLKRGLSQRESAKITGLSQTMISKLKSQAEREGLL